MSWLDCFLPGYMLDGLKRTFMMTIKAIVFDIGGVLEITPNLGVDEEWEQKLNLKSGELNERLREVWRGGTLGTITINQVHSRSARS